MEEKGLTASIHFRQAEEDDVPAIEETVRATVTAAGPWFRLGTGREVFDIVPCGTGLAPKEPRCNGSSTV